VLEDAHKALEAMSAACTALKAEEWGEAERSLHQVQETVARLLTKIADKSRDVVMVPKSEPGDSG
jgi:hypothetical protein